MHNKKRVLAILMAAAMTMGVLAGCGSKGQSSTTTQATETKTEAKAETGAETPATSDSEYAGDTTPITLKFYGEDSLEDPFTNPVAQEITRITGVKLEIDYPVGGDTQRVATMVAAGDYPDLIFAKGSYDQLVQAGALVDLTDLIEQYGPNIKKLYGDELGKLRYSVEDPSIYSLGAYGVGGASPNANPDGTFQVQLAVLEDAGYPVIKTIYELEEVLKAYVEKYPEIDGQKTIPLTLSAADWHWYITLANPSGFAQGHQDDGQWIIDKNGNATYKHSTEGNKEYFKWLNHMYNTGLLDKEAVTQSHDDYLAKLSTGAVLATADAAWDVGDADAALKKDEKFDRLRVGMPVTLDTSIKSTARLYQGWSGGWGVGITTSCADPVRAIQFLDWMCSDEGQILCNWGIEGVNYTVENGLRVRSQEEINNKLTNPNYKLETGVEQYTYPFPEYADGIASDDLGNTYTMVTVEQQIAEYTDAHKKALAGYGIETFQELFPAQEEFEIPAWGAAWQTSPTSGSELEDIMGKLNDEISMVMLPKVVVCSEADFESTWQAYQDTMIAAGLEKANVEFTKLLQDKIAFWGAK